MALFDDFRVDFYSGVKNGRIQSVHCYTPMVDNFGAFLSTATDYFTDLWNADIAIADVLARMERVFAQVDRQIDYEPHWLAAFELGLSRSDEFLKSAELTLVTNLIQRFRGGLISSLLDVGTCTARYPLALRQLVSKGPIIGIDADADCVNFAQSLVRKEGLDQRIDIRRVDLLEGALMPDKFGLVLCTLGTLSHFGYDGRDDREDELQTALRRMRDLLEPDGLLILGSWSDSAISAPQHLLEIYSKRDRMVLASGTPPRAKLEARLALAGLRVLECTNPDPRLDLYACELGS